MNKWRLTLVLLIVGAMILIVAAGVWGWRPAGSWHISHSGWQQRFRFAERSGLLAPQQFGAKLATLFSFGLSGIVILYLFPVQLRRMEQALSASPGSLVRLVALGLLASLFLVVLSLSSALTMGTFPLVILLGGILFFSSFFGYIALSYTLGHALLSKAAWEHLSPVYSFLTGLLVLFAFGQIPYVGLILGALFFMIGIGVVIVTRFGSGYSWNLGPLLED